jgi:hypothetical protein
VFATLALWRTTVLDANILVHSCERPVRRPFAVPPILGSRLIARLTSSSASFLNLLQTSCMVLAPLPINVPIIACDFDSALDLRCGHMIEATEDDGQQVVIVDTLGLFPGVEIVVVSLGDWLGQAGRFAAVLAYFVDVP